MKFKYGNGSIQKSFMDRNKKSRVLNQKAKDTTIYMSIQAQTGRELSNYYYMIIITLYD